jgi:hypothetical protein
MRSELVTLRQEFDVNLVVVNAEARFFGRPRRRAFGLCQKQGGKKDDR